LIFLWVPSPCLFPSAMATRVWDVAVSDFTFLFHHSFHVHFPLKHVPLCRCPLLGGILCLSGSLSLSREHRILPARSPLAMCSSSLNVQLTLPFFFFLPAAPPLRLSCGPIPPDWGGFCFLNVSSVDRSFLSLLILFFFCW